jgi:hypothetical protein
MKTLAEIRIVLVGTVACACLLGLAGCGGSGPRVHEVKGTLTYQGAPLPKVGITFAPVDGSRTSYGETDTEGRFTMRYSGTQDGVLEGEHVVFVTYLPEGEEGMAYLEGRAKLKSPMKEVVEKYGTQQNSPYRTTVESAIENLEIQLD